jgi:peptidoglycan/LPS O-acetylase OafA/YrhL
MGNIFLEDRKAEFDFLRAVAIVWIVGIWHLDDYASNCFYNTTTDVIKDVMLGVFCFISGYFISKDYAGCGLFFKKRFLRIYPLYVVALLSLSCFSKIRLRTFLLSLALVNEFMNVRLKTLWFISMICSFYLFVPMFFANEGRAKKAVLTLTICFLAGVLHAQARLFDYRMFQFFPLFLLGVIAANHKPTEKFISGRWVALAGLVMCLAITFYFGGAQNLTFRSVIRTIVMCLSVAPLIFFSKKCMYLSGGSRLISILSYSAFCMYLFHRPLYEILLKIYRPSNDKFLLGYLFFIGLPLLAAVSCNIQRAYDRFLQNRLTSRPDKG